MTDIVNAWWDGATVAAVERSPEGAVQVRRYPAEHTCFVESTAMTRKLFRELSGSARVRRIAGEGRWTRIVWVDYDSARLGCQWLDEHASVRTYEGGVNPVRRWMVDSDVWPAAPRGLIFDLETDSRLPFSKKDQMRVLCWAAVDVVTGEAWWDVLEEETDADERRVLESLIDVFGFYDQLLAWNGDRFDFPVLRARTRATRIDWEPRRWLWLDHLKLYKRITSQAAESGAEKQSYSLDAVARALRLPDAEKKLDASRTYEYWAAGGAQRMELVEYCIADARDRELGIERETGYVALQNALCETAGVFSDSRGLLPTGHVESLMLRLGRERDYRFGTTFRYEDDDKKPWEGEQRKGAYVLHPPEKAGILKDVHVCDFSGLYPSIVVTWNISPETLVEKPPDPNNSRPAYLPRIETAAVKPPDHVAVAANGVWFDTREQGLLPIAVQRLMDQRKQYSELQASLPPGTAEWHDAGRKSKACKIEANSFPGVLGQVTSRFYSKELYEAVTQGGALLIKSTMKVARERERMEPIEGDTDSAFIAGRTNEEFSAFVDWLNAEHYPELLRGVGCRENRISLAYEKKFRRLVNTASKHYAGAYEHYKGKEAAPDAEPEIKGLEYKRADALRLAREMQYEAICMMFKGRLVGGEVVYVDDPAAYRELADRWRQRVLEGELALADVVLSQSLGRALSGYKRREKLDGSLSEGSPHLAVARELQKRGEDVGEGTRIAYVVVDGGVSPMKAIPASDWDGTCDRHYIWESKVWPPTRRLLENAFPAEDWSAWDRTRPSKREVKRRAAEAAGQGNLLGLLKS